MKTKILNRVVITGLGVISPLGNSLSEFWPNIIAGKSGMAPITRFDTTHFKTKFAAEVKGFDPLNYMEKSEVRKYDPFSHYAIAAVAEALTEAKVDFNSLNKNKIGVIWGSGNGGMTTFQQQVTEFVEGNKIPRFNPYLVPKMIADIPSGVISIRYGLRGLNFSTISACASANQAMIDAFNYLRLGKADMIIAGGSDAAITEAGIGGFNALKALSTKNDTPQAASRPFDKERDGFVMGEGAGVLIMETLDHAIRRGAPILAEMAGAGMAADAYHLTGTHPEGEGAYLGMCDALEDAELQPSDIDYVNAHATSTPIGDISELIAMSRLFGQRPDLAISATKSMTGHLLGAAGAIESVITVLAVQNNLIPPTINTTEIEGGYGDHFNFVLGQAQKQKVEVAMNNTFGFGGRIATTIFKKYA